MRCYEFRNEGTAFGAVLVERPDPQVLAGDVLIRVRACSLNYRDVIHLRNKAGRDVAGLIPLSDGAGEVVAVAPDVAEWRVGDRVAGCFFPEWAAGPFRMAYHRTALGGGGDGMLAEYVALPATGVVRVPESMNLTEAATLPCAGLTAWYSLMTRGQMGAGATVLVLGTGGVSLFGLQWAKAAGATVIVTSSSDEKLHRAQALGATHVINYRETPTWSQRVLELTGGQGVDHILEVGGPGTLGQSMNCVAAGGQIALIGVLTGFAAPEASLFPLMARNARLDGIYVGPREAFVQMNEFAAAHDIHPIIDRVFPFEEAPAALAALERGEHFGKLVVEV